MLIYHPLGRVIPMPKRKPLNRGPRIPFTTSQLSLLESKFQMTNYLSSNEVTELANQLHLSESRVSSVGIYCLVVIRTFCLDI